MTDFKSLLATVASGQSLTREQARDAFGVLMSGEATPSQIGGFLMALRVRGESVDEIAGAVETMRARMLTVDAPEGAIDIVGTGGDASGTYNISTCSALVAAGCGVPVAKHGNRALSSKSGAADVLMALGVNIDIAPETIARCIREAGVGFMFAPAHHAAMKHVGPTRVELGTRTIFNLLGPLSNPASTKRQVIGVFAPQWVEPLAQVMNSLGAVHVWIAHGSGLDEITNTGVTTIAELKNGKITTFELTPEEVGLPRVPLDLLKGGSGEENAKALRAVLKGTKNAFRDAVLLNAGAGLIVAGKASDLKEAITAAAESIDSGAALKCLDRLVAVSNGV